MIIEDKEIEAIAIDIATIAKVVRDKWRSAKVVNGECSQMSAWNDAPKDMYRAGQPIKLVLPKFATREICMQVDAIEMKNGTWLSQSSEGGRRPEFRVLVRK